MVTISGTSAIYPEGPVGSVEGPGRLARSTSLRARRAVVMGRTGCTADEAFDALRKAS